MSQVQVVAAIIEKSGRFLLGKRNESKASAPGYWCPISGGIEIGETEQDAVVREVFEEVGLVVEPVQKICEFDTHDKKGRLHWWQVKILQGEASLKNDEHSELRWVTVDEIINLKPVFSEDIEVFKNVISNNITSGVQIRNAAPEEAKYLSDLAMRSKSTWPYDAEYLELCRPVIGVDNNYIHKWPVLVAEREGHILGWGSVAEVKNDKWLDNLWIEPNAIQKTGAGRRLFNSLVDEARKLGWSSFRIAADPYADGFYIKMGAKKVGSVQSQVKKDFFLPLFDYQFSNKLNSKRTLEVDSADWQPSLTGTLIKLRPLNESDFEALYAAASDFLIWEQHPEQDRYTLEKFQKYFRSAIDSRGALAICDRESERIIGSSRFTSYDADKSSIEVGYTFLTRDCWGKGHNRELKALMLNHAFQFVDDVFFYVGESNYRSQKAMQKIGATEVNRVSTTQLEGNIRISVVYQMKKTDWILQKVVVR